MNFNSWVKIAVKDCSSKTIDRYYDLCSDDFLSYAKECFNLNMEPEEFKNKIKKRAQLLLQYFEHNLSEDESINDITRPTVDKISKDVVNRDLHGPSLEELAQMFKIDLSELE